MRRAALALVLGAAIVAGTAGTARAANKAKIVAATCVNDGSAVTLSFRLEGVFTEEMDRAVEAGLPTTFTYSVRIFRVVPNWMDERVGEVQVKRTLQYDSLRRTYTVLRGESGRTIVAKSLDDARALMTVFERLPVVVSAGLSSAGSYYLTVKAEMERVSFPDLPFDLSRLFFFAPIWEFKTSWERVDVPMAPTAQAPGATPGGDVPAGAKPGEAP